MFKDRTRTAARIALSLGLVVFSAACGGGGGNSIIITGPLASFAPSGTPAAVDRVRIGGSSVADLVTVDVKIGGPTTSNDVYSFAFDLLLGDPAVAELVNNSAQFGSALSLGAGQSSSVLAVQTDERITVGVSKLGGGAGNRVSGSEASIVRLTFRVLGAGSTTLSFGSTAAAAIDSVGGTIGTVQFDGAAALISGS